MNMIAFSVTKKGYNTEEVDEYIQIISKEYNNLMKELEQEKRKTSELEDELYRLRRKKSNSSTKNEDGSEAVGAALIKAEKLAAQIVGNAKQEAEQIRTAAKKEMDEAVVTRSEAISHLKQIVADVNRVLQSDKQG